MVRIILVLLAAAAILSCKNSTEPKQECTYDTRCDLATFEKENSIFCAVDQGRYNRCIRGEE